MQGPPARGATEKLRPIAHRLRSKCSRVFSPLGCCGYFELVCVHNLWGRMQEGKVEDSGKRGDEYEEKRSIERKGVRPRDSRGSNYPWRRGCCLRFQDPRTMGKLVCGFGGEKLKEPSVT